MQTEEFLTCPYCGERISVIVDHSVPAQAYVEDCEVCCRPMDVECIVEQGRITLSASRADE